MTAPPSPRAGSSDSRGGRSTTSVESCAASLRALPRAVEDMFTDRCTQYAAAIAYRVLFSLFPLTIALVSVFGLVLQDDELRQRVIDELVDILPVSESGQGNIQTSIEQIATPLSAIGLVSLVALLWGASGMMASIRLGLEAAMKVDRGRPAVRAKLVDFILVAAAGMLVILIVGLSAFGAFFSELVDRFTEWAGVGDAVGPPSPRRPPARRDRRDRAAALPLRSGAEDPPSRGARGRRSSPRSACGARRRCSRSSSPTSPATTSSTARSPA